MVKIGVKWPHKNVNFSKIFRPISTKFCHTMSNWCRIRYTKFCVDICNGFGVILEKPGGGQILPPPSGARVKGTVSSKKKINVWSWFFFTSISYFSESEKHSLRTELGEKYFSWASHFHVRTTTTSMAATLEACEITTELAQIIHYWRYAYAAALLIELSLGKGSIRYCPEDITWQSYIGGRLWFKLEEFLCWAARIRRKQRKLPTTI